MIPIKETVFHAYGNYSSCHSASICQLTNGDLLVAWFAGKKEGDPNSVIMLSKKLLGHDSWSDPKIIVNVHNKAAGNPRLFVGTDNLLWLIAPINYGAWCQGGTRLFLKRSGDNGMNWTDLELFLPDFGILGKNKPLVTKSGTFLIPCEYEQYWQPVFIRSADHGIKWNVVEVPSSNFRLHQPTLFQNKSGHIIALMRSWEGYIYRTTSYDDGATWSFPEATNIPNNNSGIDVVRMNNGWLVLVCNPCHLGEDGLTIVNNSDRPNPIDIIELNRADVEQINRLEFGIVGNLNSKNPVWGPRNRLSLLLSKDDGLSWMLVHDLENSSGEFSYPAIITNDEDILHVVYTSRREEITYKRFSLQNIIDKNRNIY